MGVRYLLNFSLLAEISVTTKNEVPSFFFFFFPRTSSVRNYVLADTKSKKKKKGFKCASSDISCFSFMATHCRLITILYPVPSLTKKYGTY